MFEVARDLFKAYCAQLVNASAAFEPEYQVEVDERLTNMDFIVSKVKTLATRTACSDQAALLVHDAYLNSVPHLRDSRHADQMMRFHKQREATMPLLINETEIRVLNEAFYYCAGRARTVLRDAFPGLGTFEVEGVRNVRNQLLEHPEGKNSTVIENGSSFGFDCGPVIKGVRRVDKVDVFPDKGLYINAQEFATNLEAKLKQLLV
jgi:hypothetical protein